MGIKSRVSLKFLAGSHTGKFRLGTAYGLVSFTGCGHRHWENKAKKRSSSSDGSLLG
jgi:hypothetical protein